MYSGTQDTGAQAHAQLLDLRGDLMHHQYQCLPPESPGQIPTSYPQLRPKGEVATGQGTAEARGGSGHISIVRPCIYPPPPPDKYVWYRIQDAIRQPPTVPYFPFHIMLEQINIEQLEIYRHPPPLVTAYHFRKNP